MAIFALFGLAAAPHASAVPGLTSDENMYVSLLAEHGIGPWPGTTFYDLAQGGHAIAYDVRQGISPTSAALFIYRTNGTLTYDQASWEVACAVVVFAPEMVPPSISGPSNPGTLAASIEPQADSETALA